MKRINNLLVFAFFGFLVFWLAGCARVSEAAKAFAGVSTKILEDKRSAALKKAFPFDYNTCYKRTKRILLRRNAYIYKEDKHKKLLAIYISETDTTPVGLFFTQISASNTQI